MLPRLNKEVLMVRSNRELLIELENRIKRASPLNTFDYKLMVDVIEELAERLGEENYRSGLRRVTGEL